MGFKIGLIDCCLDTVDPTAYDIDNNDENDVELYSGQRQSHRRQQQQQQHLGGRSSLEHDSNNGNLLTVSSYYSPLHDDNENSNNGGCVKMTAEGKTITTSTSNSNVISISRYDFFYNSINIDNNMIHYTQNCIFRIPVVDNITWCQCIRNRCSPCCCISSNKLKQQQQQLNTTATTNRFVTNNKNNENTIIPYHVWNEFWYDIDKIIYMVQIIQRLDILFWILLLPIFIIRVGIEFIYEFTNTNDDYYDFIFIVCVLCVPLLLIGIDLYISYGIFHGIDPDQLLQEVCIDYIPKFYMYGYHIEYRKELVSTKSTNVTPTGSTGSKNEKEQNMNDSTINKKNKSVLYDYFCCCYYCTRYCSSGRRRRKSRPIRVIMLRQIQQYDSPTNQLDKFQQQQKRSMLPTQVMV